MYRIEGTPSVAELRRAGSYAEALTRSEGLERVELLIAFGRYDDAEDLLAELDLPAGTPLLVRVLRAQGDLRRARFAAALALSPTVGGLVDLAHLELDLGDLERAGELLARARGGVCDPHDEVGLMTAEGQLARLRGRQAFAEDLLTRALALAEVACGAHSLERAAVLLALADAVADDGRAHEAAALRSQAEVLRRAALAG